MIEIGIGFALSAFFAGIITFLAPCTLPMVPAYLGFISGVNPEELKDKKTAAKARRKIFLNGVFFIVGFSLIFIIFGTLAGLLGQSIAPYRIWLARVGGLFVILFGLFMLGLFKLPFLRVDKHLNAPKFLKRGKPTSSLAMGSAFAFGWTPCVGPILGSILLIASTSSTALSGGVLLTIFSLGLAIPFLLVTLAYSKATQYISRVAKYLRAVEVIGGIFLIVLGVLLLTNNFGLLIQYGYNFFDFFNYEGILEFL